MQYQIFVEDQSDQHFVASVIGMPNIEADGNIESEAISKAENALRIQLAKAISARWCSRSAFCLSRSAR
jgi:predicted RNase H-like HicB family nuclease